MLPAAITEHVTELRAADKAKDELRALRAVAALKIQLAALERSYVERLRRKPIHRQPTWHQIGEALGLPRQAVHRKYADVGESS